MKTETIKSDVANDNLRLAIKFLTLAYRNQEEVICDQEEKITNFTNDWYILSKSSEVLGAINSIINTIESIMDTVTENNKPKMS